MNTDTTDTPELSLLVSCFNEEHSIETFHRRASGALFATGRSFEIILVNDGSADATWEKLKALFAAHDHIAVILDLFRNAGQQASVTAALNEARGDKIILLDSDLQLSPEELPQLLAKYDEGFDLVTGYRKNRRDAFTRVIPSRLANIIMRRASRSTIMDFGCTFKVYNGDLLRAFNFGPHHIFSNVDCIAAITRYAQVPVSHAPRQFGKSGWTFRKLWSYNMDNMLKLSQVPFQYLAALCALAGALFTVRIFLGFFSDAKLLSDVTNGLLLNALVIVLLALLAVLALIGEFTIRTFLRVQENPKYIVRERHDRNR